MQQVLGLQPSDISIAMVVAFGIQQGIDVIDSLITGFGVIKSDPTSVSYKKAILKIISLVVGFAAAQFMNVDVLRGLPSAPEFLHKFITALALAGGTEGVNSVLKYAAYSKENKKNDAAAKLPADKLDPKLAVMNSK